MRHFHVSQNGLRYVQERLLGGDQAGEVLVETDKAVDFSLGAGNTASSDGWIPPLCLSQRPAELSDDRRSEYDQTGTFSHGPNSSFESSAKNY